jgi:hypothetical protein
MDLTDSAFHFNADPDPAPHQCGGNLRPLCLQTLQASIISLHGFILSVHGPPRLHFEPRKLLNFDFDADPDPGLKKQHESGFENMGKTIDFSFKMQMYLQKEKRKTS